MKIFLVSKNCLHFDTSFVRSLKISGGTYIFIVFKLSIKQVAALFAASVFAEPDSEAEAKPWLAYAGYPYAATYAHAAYPYAGVYGLGYNGYALGGHYLGKRSADSEPEAEADAKPWLAYGAYPYAATYAHAAYPYAGVYGLGYNGYALGAHYLGKRSADADPEAYYGGYGYGYPYHSYGYPYAHPLGYSYGGYAYGKQIGHLF